MQWLINGGYKMKAMIITSQKGIKINICKVQKRDTVNLKPYEVDVYYNAGSANYIRDYRTFDNMLEVNRYLVDNFY